MCNLPFAKSRSRPDRSQRKAKLHKRIVFTNYAVPTGALDSKSARMLLESFQYLNQQMAATILMVTHDAFTASYANRILFIKDGKLFNELVRGRDTRKEFFNRIIEVVTLLGGELNDVI